VAPEGIVEKNLKFSFTGKKSVFVKDLDHNIQWVDYIQ